MPAVFVPPIALANPPVGPEHRGIAYRLFRYLGPQPVGQSVVRVGGTYRTVPVPDQLLLEGLTQGVDYFLGGHEYVITDEVAVDLTADGYGGAIGEIQLPDSWGSFSATPWGALDSDFWAGV